LQGYNTSFSHFIFLLRSPGFASVIRQAEAGVQRLERLDKENKGVWNLEEVLEKEEEEDEDDEEEEGGDLAIPG
jgi:hypothetical protein